MTKSGKRGDGKGEYELETGLEEQFAESSVWGVPELGHENDFGLQTGTHTCAHSHLGPQPAPWPLPLCRSQTRAPSLLFRAVSWPCCQHLSLCWMKLLGVGADCLPRAVGMQVSYKRNAGGQPARGACVLRAMLMVTHWPGLLGGSVSG